MFLTDRIWYPFTQMTDIPNKGFVKFVRAEGNYLYDASGKKYFDGYSSLWVNLHGHNRPEITEAIKEQSYKLDHTTLLGATNEPAQLLANKLAEVAPIEDAWVFYSDSGSTSVEIACKMAFQYFQNIGYSKKTRFLSLKNSYHGDTLGMVGLGGIDIFHEIFHSIIRPSVKVKPPYWIHGKSDGFDISINELETLFKKEADSIAAFVMEPILQGAAGMLRIEDGYLRKVRELCTKYNVLMIVDEVATGFGRTAKMFACEHENVKPDIVCMAKGISGGVLPLAATLVTNKVYEAFLGAYEDFKAFFHGHSYTGNPIACAAALASLDIFASNRVMEHVATISRVYEERMKALLEIEQVLDVRYKGIMGGVEIGINKKQNESYPVEKRVAFHLCNDSVEKGLMIRPLGQVIPLVPPLSTTTEEMNEMFDILEEVIKSYFSRGYK